MLASKLSYLGERSEPRENARGSGEAARACWQANALSEGFSFKTFAKQRSALKYKLIKDPIVIT